MRSYTKFNKYPLYNAGEVSSWIMLLYMSRLLCFLMKIALFDVCVWYNRIFAYCVPTLCVLCTILKPLKGGGGISPSWMQLKFKKIKLQTWKICYFSYSVHIMRWDSFMLILWFLRFPPTSCFDLCLSNCYNFLASTIEWEKSENFTRITHKNWSIYVLGISPMGHVGMGEFYWWEELWDWLTGFRKKWFLWLVKLLDCFNK